MQVISQLLLFTLSLMSGAATSADDDRIVSLGGSVTEIVAALGSADRLVAVDDSSLYPTRLLETLPSVGYYRAVSAEGVLALSPDLVIADASAGPPATLSRLAAAGVRVEQVPAITDIDSLIAAIEYIGAVLGKAEPAGRLAAQTRERLQVLQRALSAVDTPPRALFLLSAGGGAPMVAGRETAANRLLTLARADNIAADFRGYKPASAEMLVRLQPDVIITTERTLAAAGGRDAVLALPGLAVSPAARRQALVVMDDLLALGFGPRLPVAVERLASALHPQWSAPH